MPHITDYLAEVQEKFKTGIAREHAYRPALQKLLASADEALNPVNDAARTEIGMPDFVVLRTQGNVPIGIVEAKDIGDPLDKTEKSKQLQGYMAHNNVILTDYLEFRWYVDGEKRETVRIAHANGKIDPIPEAFDDLTHMLSRFAQEVTPTVRSAKGLAKRIAGIAREIAYFIEKDLNSTEPTETLRKQQDAFQKTLLPDLDIPSFADMYAQTITYGLFAARVNHEGDPSTFERIGASEDIPRTNPFLRKLFHMAGFDLGRRLTWMVDGLVDILRHTDTDDLLKDFGNRTQQNDPVVHFYETFLSEYNPQLREQRGVYYTPEPVVKYIVRSVDHILKTKFNRPTGLADEKTLILDPATGTGTFLYFVIEHIKQQFEGQSGMWESYVAQHLLPRIFGFELLMAPYTVAHMNLGLSLNLNNKNIELKDDQRLGIYLTNTLEEAVQAQEVLFAEFIAQEANEAAHIKRDKPIMVVLGNPPYSGHSANKGEWISELHRDYYFVDGKPLGERNSKWLQNDYVKFIRFGQWRIEQTGSGVLAFITDNSYLDGLIFRGMRQQLMQTFTDIYILDLHGNSNKKETAPDGTADQNVFDIMQGVSIVLFVKQAGKNGLATIHHLDLWGKRTDKYDWLNLHDVADTDWKTLQPETPHYLFIPQDLTFLSEYEVGWQVTNIMNVNVTGFQSHRDSFAVDYEIDEVFKRATAMRNLDFSDTQLRSKYNLKDNRDWKLDRARTQIINDEEWENKISVCNYRPFDNRYCYFSTVTMDYPRSELINNVLNKDNLCLNTSRQTKLDLWKHALVSANPTPAVFLEIKDGSSIFPLYLYPEKQDGQLFAVEDDGSDFPLSAKGRRPNLSKAFVDAMVAKLGLKFETEGSAFQVSPDAVGGDSEGGQPDWFGPEDVFYYAYAVFHSPTYRERYAEFLKIDFPRLPLTSDLELFKTLVKLGAELVGLHLMKSPKLSTLMTTFDVDGDNIIPAKGGYPKYNEKEQAVYINKTQYFGGVPKVIWEFHIGGYQVLHKWLKDRRGRELSFQDLRHYQQVVVALSETNRIMDDIDDAIPQFPIE